MLEDPGCLVIEEVCSGFTFTRALLAYGSLKASLESYCCYLLPRLSELDESLLDEGGAIAAAASYDED